MSRWGMPKHFEVGGWVDRRHYLKLVPDAARECAMPRYGTLNGPSKSMTENEDLTMSCGVRMIRVTQDNSNRYRAVLGLCSPCQAETRVSLDNEKLTGCVSVVPKHRSRVGLDHRVQTSISTSTYSEEHAIFTIAYARNLLDHAPHLWHTYPLKNLLL